MSLIRAAAESGMAAQGRNFVLPDDATNYCTGLAPTRLFSIAEAEFAGATLKDPYQTWRMRCTASPSASVR
jgi:predicted MarR family transcription regulator